MMEALDLYRAMFRPSQWLDRPYAMLGFNVFAADSDEEGQLFATSLQQAFVALRTGQPGKLKPPIAGYSDTLPPAARGSARRIAQLLGDRRPGHGQGRRPRRSLRRTGADELMVTSQIYDHAARVRPTNCSRPATFRDATDGAARESEDQAATSPA